MDFTAREEWVEVDANVKSMVNSLTLLPGKSYVRLNQIDRIRSYGLSDHIDLPQLVVCGDQSAGKSSVLEGITGIPFPRQDGMCTRFATEIILRHDLHANSITATIIPGYDRAIAFKAELRRFVRSLSSFDELPMVIADAAKAMGIRGYSDTEDASPFASDTLRLEIVGNTGLHLTVVDLPGLISGAADEDDPETVEALVAEYMKNPRTIILAVIQANKDIETEGIIRRAKKYDQIGDRTVGIITKPDLINKGTEARIAALTMDRQRLKLGFFLLKNPAPSELEQGISPSARATDERSFFTTNPWKEQRLDMSRTGAGNLRLYLQDLLDKHVEREMPKVRQDVQRLLLQTKSDLGKIGSERHTIEQMRMYLMQISMQFYDICKAAADGSYDGSASAFFTLVDGGPGNRLRATVHIENTAFATYMRDSAAKRKQVASISISETENEEELPLDDRQILVTAADMVDWVKSIYVATRGRELPGSYNHALLSELHHQQSSRWATIAKDHIGVVHKHVSQFAAAALLHTVIDSDVRQNVHDLITEKLALNYTAALEELEKILSDEQYHPITYNHYLTDNVQKSRQQKISDQIKKSVESYAYVNGKLHVGNTQGELNSLVTGLQRSIECDMDKQGCNEALETMKSYYKVSRKTFVDNVCRQVIERHILLKLTKIFDPLSISQYSDVELERLAHETPEVQKRREELREVKHCLEQCLAELRA